MNLPSDHFVQKDLRRLRRLDLIVHLLPGVCRVLDCSLCTDSPDDTLEAMADLAFRMAGKLADRFISEESK